MGQNVRGATQGTADAAVRAHVFVHKLDGPGEWEATATFQHQIVCGCCSGCGLYRHIFRLFLGHVGVLELARVWYISEERKVQRILL
jgi:hypothetical protein